MRATPPRKRSPGTCSSHTTPTVITERTATASKAPNAMARFCRWRGTLRAASAITIALSPESIRLMTTMAAKELAKASRASMRSTLSAAARAPIGKPDSRIENPDARLARRAPLWSNGDACRQPAGRSLQRGVALAIAFVRTGLTAPERSAHRAGARFVSETFELDELEESAMNRPRFRRFFRHGLLTQLIAFEACLRLGGVTRAAEELCLAQPTVSGLLKRLSDTFGAPLMHARG